MDSDFCRIPTSDSDCVLSPPSQEGAILWNELMRDYDMESCIEKCTLIPLEKRKLISESVKDHVLWEKVKKSLAADFCKGETLCSVAKRNDFVLFCALLGKASGNPAPLAMSTRCNRFSRSCSGFSLDIVLARISEFKSTAHDF